ncbi:MAG: hypothetical protein ACRCT8_12345 [Lacipirellulaceae bacterium]
MKRTLWLSVLGLGAAVWCVSPAALAQKYDPYTARLAMGTEAYTWESASGPPPSARPVRLPAVATAQPVAPTLNPTTQRVLAFYNAQRAQQTLAQMPMRPRGGAAAPRPVMRSPKPFNTVVTTPTVSPYLNLYREDEGDGAPNYHAFVRPHQDQIEQNYRASAQLQRLQGQVRQAEGRPIGTNAPSGASARYGDTGRYYSTWGR